jgi:hydroxybutyrate-dimer hydrolase
MKHREEKMPKRQGLAAAFAATLGACSASTGGDEAVEVGVAAVMGPLGHGDVRCATYDGVSDDLLTGGLGKSGLAAQPPKIADPLNPTAAELRRLAIYTNYRAIVDISAGGGYGTLYGPNVLADGTVTTDEGKIAGSECLTYADDASGRRNVTLMVQIPESFDPGASCIVTGPSSGSRGIYGAIGTSGEWGLKNGCAVAYTDKGTGTGAHDLQNDTVNLIDGVRESADAAGQRANFRAQISDAERVAFNADTPGRFAFKHAHSEQNPEADWDVNVLQATLFAFQELKRRYPDATISRANTIVIGSSISNGGAASLRAAEIDRFGLIDGVAVSEPNISPPPGPALSIAQGEQPRFTQGGKSLYDYATHINIFQGCANLSRPDAPLNSVPTALAENRCTALHARGLVTSGTVADQAREAQAIINRYGILGEQNVVQPALWTLVVPQAIAVTYANAYVGARVQDNLCDYSFGAADATGNPIAISSDAEAILFGTSSGIPPTGGINIIDNASLGGARQNTLSISPAGAPDQNLDGALCLRALWTGGDPVTGAPPSGAALLAHRRLHQGIADIRATADLNGTPAIIVQGRADGVVHPNHAGRAYYARNRQVEAEQSQLRYIEVTNAQHLDALNSVAGFDTRFVPLHFYFVQAMDLMYRHLKGGGDLPPSQVVHTTPRGGVPGQAPAITPANLPPIALMPAEADRIAYAADTLKVPE